MKEAVSKYNWLSLFSLCPPPKKVKKPGLSQARALIFPKDLVSLSNSISYGKDTL